MGYPVRFYGAGEPMELDGVTIPGRCTVEVTFRTHQQRLLLTPDREANEILLGCLGRAYDRYPDVRLHNFNFQGNHGCLLSTPSSPEVMSNFMRDFLSTAARRINGHRDREGTFWERRYRAIPVCDQDAVEDRFRYVLTQGTKENLVASARDWPGVHCAGALLGGPQLVGRWRDRDTEYERQRQQVRRAQRAAARGREVTITKVRPIWIEYPIDLAPLPHWMELSPGQRRARVATILRRDDELTAERHKRDRTRPLGVRAIVRTNPFARPVESKKSPAPLCHASSTPARSGFRKAYGVFLDRLRAADGELATLMHAVGFPFGATSCPLRAPASNLADAKPPPAWVAAADARATGPPLPDDHYQS